MDERMVPVFLKPSKKKTVVVFGGGNIALRKCRQFAGFRITVIAEKTVPGIEKVCDEIVLEHFDSSDLFRHLGGAFISVAATNSEDLNKTIMQQSLSLGILANSAHGGGDLLLPSSVRREGYTVSISSEGSVPAFPPYVAEQIDRFLGEEYDLMLSLLGKIRTDLKDTIREQPMRARCLAEIIRNDDIWYMLRDGRIKDAEKTALSIRSKYAD